MARKKPKENVVATDLQSIEEGIRKILGSDEPDTGISERWFTDTGNMALNWVMSGRLDGGWPNGFVELFGDPSTGKSLLIAKAIASMQVEGAIVILADIEGRWDDDFAEIHGVDREKLLKFSPGTIEELATKLYDLLTRFGHSGIKVGIFIDGIAMLGTASEAKDIIEGKMAADQGARAKRIRHAVRVLRDEVNKTGAFVMVSNHVIAQPNSYVPRTTPGGQAVPFQCNVRLELLKSSPIVLDGKLRPIGTILHCKVTKNSVAPPFGECFVNLYWADGVDRLSGLADIMLDLGMISRSGAWLKYANKSTAQEESFYASGLAEFLEKHPELLEDERWSKPYFLQPRK